jgi:hypothetical protein
MTLDKLTIGAYARHSASCPRKSDPYWLITTRTGIDGHPEGRRKWSAASVGNPDQTGC